MADGRFFNFRDEFGVIRRYENRNSPVLQKRYYSKEPVKCKVAIITGGARGIGYAIAEQLLCAGAQAVILGDTLVPELEKACCTLNNTFGPDKALYQPLDVTKKDEMESIFHCTKERFGKIDIVVNNAGILMDSKWRLMVKINILGLIHGSWLGFQYMGTNNGGNGGYIINNASILGLQPLFGTPVYVGTKHFVIGFTRSIGSDYFHKITNVKAMAVCPGVTETALIWDAKDGAIPGFGELGVKLAEGLRSYPNQESVEVGKGVVTMIKANENGSVWVSEGNEFYKVNIPDRKTWRVKDDGDCGGKPDYRLKCPKKKDACPKKAKPEPCKAKEKKAPCKAKEKKEPCKAKEKKEPCKAKEKKEPCKAKEKKDPCKAKEKKDPCKAKEKKDACKATGKKDKKLKRITLPPKDPCTMTCKTKKTKSPQPCEKKKDKK